jgi:hypothetical protein
MDLVIHPDGTVTAIYSEELDLSALGLSSISRASHVEPDDSGQWWADLAPSHGPRLGPFTLRSLAITAEIHWLTEHRLAISVES